MILVAGSANLDFVTRVESIPLPGETVLGAGYELYAGGKGANQAVACARAGGPETQVAFLGALGPDSFAERLRQSLREAGVQDRTISVPDPTGAAFIAVSREGENAITVAAGANRQLRPEHLGQFAEWPGLTHLILQLEIPLETVCAFAAQAHACGVHVTLNAAPAHLLPADLLTHVDLLIVNEGELDALLEAEKRTALEDKPEQRLRAAQALGPRTVTVTLGRRGSVTRHGEQVIHTPAVPVNAADTTGAGDTFVGSLVAALAGGQPLEAALHFAAAAGALACTRPGAQASMPTRAEILALMGDRG